MQRDSEAGPSVSVGDDQPAGSQPIETPVAESSVIFRLEVQMGPAHLTAVRRLVVELAQPIVGDSELAARLALATHELLENAVKYSADARRLITLQLLATAQRKISVTVINVSNQALYESLKRKLDQLDAATDPMQTYHRMISHSMHQETGSGLGLARIYAEADMSLHCELKDDRLFVRAETEIGDTR